MSIFQDIQTNQEWWFVIGISIVAFLAIIILILCCVTECCTKNICCKESKEIQNDSGGFRGSHQYNTQFKQIRALRDQTPIKSKPTNQRIELNSEFFEVLETKPTLFQLVQGHRGLVNRGGLDLENQLQNEEVSTVPSHNNINKVLQHSTPIRSEVPLPEAHFDQNNDSTIKLGHQNSEKQSSDTSNNPRVKSNHKGKFRPIIIDGMDIGQMYGGDKKFSAKGIQIAYKHFKNLGYENNDIIIVMKNISQNKLTKQDRALINYYHKINVLCWSPQKKVENEFITSNDDLFILENAYMHEGIVLTSDQYRIHYKKYQKYQDIIKNRMIKPTFTRGGTKDCLILPIDPLGSNGPMLDEFLRFN